MKTINWDILSKKAWIVRENASILGKTKVGASLITEKGNIYVGCNIEQIYRNKDIHAEINAISNMITSGETKFLAIIVVAERKMFTPCGSCMDWIFQFGGENVKVAYQTQPNGIITDFTAKELMPFYPS
jgi:cytidine deaminase